ncbi:DUF4148 domain-containing protein [Pandoraea sp.]|uniref:DUF4148 domain-containing protein n=1 Tax=Pandoraea sp. TaxID=1883445 RepID=UPI0025E60ED6|nr:DUF4148 domain-containing protein [Pandoraea sp.]
MKTGYTIAAALLLSVAGTLPALASDAYPGGSMLSWVHSNSPLSQATVYAHLVKAEQHGLLDQGNTVFPKTPRMPHGTQHVLSSTKIASAAAPVTYRHN